MVRSAQIRSRVVMGASQFVLTPDVFARFEGRVAELASLCRVLVVAEVDGFTDEGDIVGEPPSLGLRDHSR